jgi:phage shock protein PspC (stress-responsive transcriptional regulator)
MTIKIKDWFVWNVQVNNEKGTAGGNIKINFPIKSALVIGLICIAIAIFAKASEVSFVVTLIFLSFAVYHFRKWYKTVKFISANEAFQQIKRLTRDSDSKIIGGVCAGISKHYQISLVLTRITFVGLFFIGGIGIYIYLLLWFIIPIQGLKQTQ